LAVAHGKKDVFTEGEDILLTLAGISRGKFAAEASGKLAELVADVKRYDKKGTLTLSLEVAPAAQDLTVTLKATVTARKPVQEHAAIFFVDENDHLTRDDPTIEPLFGRSEVEDGDRH